MKKLLLVVTLVSVLSGCGTNKSLTLIKSEKRMAEKYQRIGLASFSGCLSAVEEEAAKRQDPMIMLAGRNFCVGVAKEVIDQTLKTGPCAENDAECHFLSGCVKVKVALSQNGLLSTTKNEEEEIAKACDSALATHKEAAEKDKVVSDGQ